MSAPASVPTGKHAKPTKLRSPIKTIECAVLRRAAERLSKSSAVAASGADGAPLAELLVAVCGMIHTARVDQGKPLDPGVGSAEGRRVLDLLRMHVVMQWTGSKTPPPAVTMLSYLSAFETVGRHMESATDLSNFSDALVGTRGLELVVEVAHDLRSPLTSILFLAETLQRGRSGPVSDLQQRQLGLIYSAALGMSTMASNVMEMARGGTRLANEDPTPFSVSETFESVRDIVQPMAEEKGLKVRLSPPSSDRRLGAGQALSRVILNLTTNAIKFTEDGFVELVGKSTSLTRVEFSVRDTGHGISPAALDTLYHPFRRVQHNDRSAFSSTGLGLSLCRRLVAAMGAELQVETQPDWGTRFSFELDLPPARAL